MENNGNLDETSQSLFVCFFYGGQDNDRVCKARSSRNDYNSKFHFRQVLNKNLLHLRGWPVLFRNPFSVLMELGVFTDEKVIDCIRRSQIILAVLVSFLGVVLALSCEVTKLVMGTLLKIDS